MTATSAAVQTAPPLSPRAAFKTAWRLWTLMLVLPFFVFMAAIAYLMTSTVTARPELSHNWFVFAILWTGVTIPAAFFVRSRLFADYWQGRTVAPGRYLAGMLVVWLAIEVAGLISLAGCFVSGSLLPDLIPALFAFVLYLMLWPTGSAMTSPVGAEDDSSIFRHPR